MKTLLNILAKGFKFSNDESALTQHLPLITLIGGFTAWAWAYFQFSPWVYFVLFLIVAVGWEVYWKKEKNKVIGFYDIFWSMIPIFYNTVLLYILQ